MLITLLNLKRFSSGPSSLSTEVSTAQRWIGRLGCQIWRAVGRLVDSSGINRQSCARTWRGPSLPQVDRMDLRAYDKNPSRLCPVLLAPTWGIFTSAFGFRSVPPANLILHFPRPKHQPYVMFHAGVVCHHREMLADAMGNNGIKPIFCRRIAAAGTASK